ncbi:MAG: ribonuclease III domain-containing protein [Candidatus Helarchaeota archaeon]
MGQFKEIFERNYPSQWNEFEKVLVKIQNILNYQFKDLENLWNAVSIRGSKLPTKQFERLEFLGDSILKTIHSILLFDRGEDFPPSELTAFRMNFEKNEYLASLAKEFQCNRIGALLGLGILSRKQAADFFEALVGAVFIDCERNLQSMLKIFKGIIHFERNIKEYKKSPWGSKDPKSFLHEWVQRKYGNDVEIQYPSTNEGSMNAPKYKVQVLVKNRRSNKTEIEGPWVEGYSKKKTGEKEAAKALLMKLKDERMINSEF